MAHYRTCWISDVHLGTRGSKAAALLEFMKNHEFEKLYLVGDIIDIWPATAAAARASSSGRSTKAAAPRASATGS